MHLQPSPLFNLPSDNVSMLGAVGTSEGRIFLAGKDSCLYEVVYQVRMMAWVMASLYIGANL
jgi:nuclear pore complex protein Nup155